MECGDPFILSLEGAPLLQRKPGPAASRIR